MLYLFDLDGTLISSYMENADRAYGVWAPLPGRAERLRQLVEQGERVAIITNQAGVGLGFTTEAAAWEKIRDALAAVGLPPDATTAYVCFAHKGARRREYRAPRELARRKPSGAMIREAIRDHPEAARQGVLYVGDRPEDQAAARDAGVDFQWAHEFFRDTPP
jgi:D-glycero-D-manno-heptose 1,7-bisphosphate phosphatase